jgi:hypothetical protein
MTAGKDKLITQIGTQIVEDALTDADDWVNLIMIAQGEEGVLHVTTFTYSSDGRITRGAPRDLKAVLKVRQLREVMAESDVEHRRWKACLMRFNMESSEVHFDFEYEDSDRWAFNDKNWEAKAEGFRHKV